MAVNPNTTVRKLISLPRDLAREVEDFRFERRIGQETEAIRRLVRRGLDAERQAQRMEPAERR